MNGNANQNAPLQVWWVLWAATLGGLAAFYVFLKSPEPSEPSTTLRFLPIALFLAAVVVRWLVMPRFQQRSRAFPIFVVGVALSEACALTGIFLSPDLRNLWFVLACVSLVQFVPIFVNRFED
jgi:FtsH-binding integral membrane protein